MSSSQTSPRAALTRQSLRPAIERVLWHRDLRVDDIHTHLFTPNARKLVKSGIIDLLLYHYVYREHLGWRRDVAPAEFWKLDPRTAADQAWKTHFVSRPGGIHLEPVSEGMRGVLTILKAFGLDVNAVTLDEACDFFSRVDPDKHTDRVLELAGVTHVIGTNNPFDDDELEFYKSGVAWHPKFKPALRLDDLVLNPAAAFRKLRTTFDCADADEHLSPKALKAARNFVDSWLDGKFLPPVAYVGISFPPDFPWDEVDSPQVKVLEKVVIPSCAAHGISLFLMPEPVRQLAPQMRNAGDFLGKMDCVKFGRFAQRHPEVDIWVSPLNFASQYEMSALTCNLPHVKPWSTWWYNHQPGLTQQMTNMRFEMHGSNFFPFNSDARVLEQLIYKWHHFKQEFAAILENQLGRLIDLGRTVTEDGIRSWVETIFDRRRLDRATWQQVLSETYGD